MSNNIFEKNLIPDFLIRLRIRNLHRKRLNSESSGSLEEQQNRLRFFIDELRKSPIAIDTEAANDQHYELPPSFFEKVLGKHLKYSSGYWEPGNGDLSRAEEAMLERYIERAKISDGLSILELGSGWGSLSLYLARRFPNSNIVGVSNSSAQKKWIESICKKNGLNNVQIITADINHFSIDQKFDRIVSIEMIEHLRNIEKLFEKVSLWLKKEGLFFVHIFTHLRFAYPFIDHGTDEDWMARYFFTGGMIPSDSLPLYFQKDLQLLDHWKVDGTHYQKTAEAWLFNMDREKETLFSILENHYGKQSALKWWVYWRVFFMACAEFWGFENGKQWLVSHYLFQNRL